MDMEKVPRAKIMDCLDTRNVNSKLIRVIKCLYKEIRNCVISKHMLLKLFLTKEVNKETVWIHCYYYLYGRTNYKYLMKSKSIIHWIQKSIKNCHLWMCLHRWSSNYYRRELDLKENLNMWNEMLTKNGIKWTCVKQKSG